MASHTLFNHFMEEFMKQFGYTFFALALILMYTTSYAQDYEIDLSMDGGQEVPPSGSSGLGFDPTPGYSGTYFNSATKEFFVDITFFGLTGMTTGAHIHGPALPGASAGILYPLTSFPSGVTSGSYSGTFILSSIDSASLMSGMLYINIHTTFAPGGEIRGQLIPTGPLPVEITSFTAIAKGRRVELAWKTATEVNNYGFEVERRAADGLQATTPLYPPRGGTDRGVTWGRIGFVEGNGTTNTPQNYSFTDNNISSGTYSYRLKQIDRDGQFEYSQEVKVAINNAPMKFELAQNYPNPFNPSTTITFTVPTNGRAALKIFNTLGQEVATLYNKEAEAGGYHQVQFKADNLPSGIYFSQLEHDGKHQMKKMIMLK